MTDKCVGRGVKMDCTLAVSVEQQPQQVKELGK